MTVRHIGNALGVAVTGVVFNALAEARLADLLLERGADDASQRVAELHGLLAGSAAAARRLAEMPAEVQGQVKAIADTAFVHGFVAAMLASVPLCLIGFVLVFWIKPAAKPEKGSA
jgi:hypothetical protein